MKNEVQNWLAQSEDDFDAAVYNFLGKQYYVAAFLCQQSVEKALKALFICEKGGDIPQSHSLIYLAVNTSVPEKFFPFLKELAPKYVNTRYPDAAVDLPSKIYTETNTEPIIEQSREILHWIDKQLKNK